jgi:hypothetical protein
MARTINKNELGKVLTEQMATASARLRQVPGLKENIVEAFTKLTPDHIIQDSDLKKVLMQLSQKATITKSLVEDTVRTVVEARDRSDLRMVITNLLSKMKPTGFVIHDDDPDLIIQRFNLKSNTSLTRIRQAVGEFMAAPRNLENVSQTELRYFVRKELEKRGPVDARKVNAIVQQYLKTADPERPYSPETLRTLVRANTPNVDTQAPSGLPGDEEDVQALKARRKKKHADDANPYVTSGDTVPTGTRYRKTFFDTIRTKMQRYGLRPLTKQARNWLTDSVQKAQSPTQSQLFKRSIVATTMAEAFIGRMFFYAYEAKWKDELPFWDRFPLIFVVDIYEDGWLGINLHYLPMRLRMQLFDALLALADNRSLDDVTRLRLSYNYIKSFSTFPLVKPCLKRYLMHHVESSLLEVKPLDWEIAVFLPCEQFQKQSKERVWTESRRIIRKQQGR